MFEQVFRNIDDVWIGFNNLLQGKVGDAIGVDRAREAARLCALNALAAAATQTRSARAIRL